MRRQFALSLGTIETRQPRVCNLEKRFGLLDVLKELKTRGMKRAWLFVWDGNLGL